MSEIRTVVVDIRTGDGIGRQAYAADNFEIRENQNAGIRIAEFAPGAWLSVRTGDALAPVRDPAAAALGIARQALRDILAELADTDLADPAVRQLAGKISELAENALEAIHAETE